jgi:aryl-alcohol dehydrogenase-like predicted oxidoreductase
MRTRPLGKTGLQVSELALGTWGLCGDAYVPVPEFEQEKVIERACALGVTLVETADVYGLGRMESRLGERLGANGAVMVATKIGTDRSENPPRKRFSPEYLRAAFEKSRERLKRPVVDIVLLHNPSAVTLERDDATGVLAELKSTGAIRAWGVSAGSVEVARRAIERGAEVLSLAYNALFSNDLVELHADVEKSGVGVLAHSALGHGLLAGYWSLHRTFQQGDHRAERWTSEDLRRRVQQVSALRALMGDDVTTLRGGAVRYVLANPDVSSVVLGPRNAVQLDQLVRESGKEPPYLTEEKLKKFALRLEDLGIRR